jgi:segregation and condensation protein A
MKELNVNVASDFLLMAAQLIYIKSRTLLPVDPDEDPDEEDPREELVRRLLEYEKFRNAAEMLHQRELVEKASFTRAGRLELVESDLEPEIAVTLVDMMAVFRDIMKRMEERPTLDFALDEYTVSEMARMIVGALAESPQGVSFRELMARFQSRAALITAFLAILEMAKMHVIRIGQKNLFDDIEIRIESGASVDDVRLQHLSLN